MATITEQDSQQKLEKLLDFCQVRIPQYHTMLVSMREYAFVDCFKGE